MNKIINGIKKSFDKNVVGVMKHSSFYMIGNICIQALAFITIPIFTRLLTPSDYGILSIVNLITKIFTILMVLNLGGALVRNYYEQNNNYGTLISTVSVFTVVYNIVIVAIMCIFRDYFSSFFNIAPNLFMLGILTASATIFSTYYLSYLRASQQSKKYALFSFLKSLVILLVSICIMLLLSDKRYLGRIYSGLFVNIAFSIFALVYIIKLSSNSFDLKQLNKALRFGVPLVPHAMSGLILSQFDRIIINQYCDSADTGLYSFAYNVSLLLAVAINSINFAFAPEFYKKRRDNKFHEIDKMLNTTTHVVLLIALALILFSTEIVMILADSSYYQGLTLVPILILGNLIVYFYKIYANYSFYRKKTINISINTIIACVINIVLNYIYIPKYGYIAGAYTTVFSYVCLGFLHFINAKYILKEDVFKVSKLTPSYLFFAVMVTLYYLLKLIKLNYWLLMLAKIVLLAVSSYYVYKFTNNKRNTFEVI